MSESKIITYEHIVVKLASEEIGKSNIRELKIEKRINDHVRVYITGIASEEKKDKYVEMSDITTQISVDCVKGGEATCLFKGVITNIEVRMVRGVYYFEIEGASYTYNIDIKLCNRSFQDNDMKYKELVEEVISSSNAICNNIAASDEKLEKFIFMYHETIWNFLKRMASRPPFRTGLVADATGEKARFCFGIPKGKERIINEQNINYSIKKKVADYRNMVANHTSDIGENDFIYYELLTDEFFNIGDMVNLMGKKLYVFQSTAIIKGGILTLDCILTPEYGLKQNTIYNEKIVGVAIEGKVIDIEYDLLKVSLVGIGEKSQTKDKACFFTYATPYTTEGNTGWYCMPELDDYVWLYFPTKKEEDAFVTTAVRHREKDENGIQKPRENKGDKISEPKIKYFRTNFGKEIMFSEKEIVITGKDNEILVRLNEEKGIEIFSQQEVRITAKKDLSINSEEGKVIISAKDEIDLACKSSSITMNGETHIKGSQVKIN